MVELTRPRQQADLGGHAARGAAWQMLGFLCLTGSSYFMIMLLARGLGRAAYSVYGIVYSALLASELILRIGVPQSLTKLVAGSSAAPPRPNAPA